MIELVIGLAVIIWMILIIAILLKIAYRLKWLMLDSQSYKADFARHARKTVAVMPGIKVVKG